MTLTTIIGHTKYTITLMDDAATIEYEEQDQWGTWTGCRQIAGRGTWTGCQIKDCTADLPYEEIENAILYGILDAIRYPGEKS